jgi:hypothetical protein
MSLKGFFYHLNFTLWVSLRYGVDCTFFGAQDCVAVPWNGAPQSVARGAPQSGDRAAEGSVRKRDRAGVRIPLRGRTFFWQALLRPVRSHHSASLRLALYPKNRTLHPVQLPDLG